MKEYLISKGFELVTCDDGKFWVLECKKTNYLLEKLTEKEA